MNFQFHNNFHSEKKEPKSFFQPKSASFQTYLNSFANSAGSSLKSMPSKLSSILDRYIYTEENPKPPKQSNEILSLKILNDEPSPPQEMALEANQKSDPIFVIDNYDGTQQQETGQFVLEKDDESVDNETDYQSTFGYVKEESYSGTQSSEEGMIQKGPGYSLKETTKFNTLQNKFSNLSELFKPIEKNENSFPSPGSSEFKPDQPPTPREFTSSHPSTPQIYNSTSSLPSFQDFFKMCKSNSNSIASEPRANSNSNLKLPYDCVSPATSFPKEASVSNNSTFKQFNHAIIMSGRAPSSYVDSNPIMKSASRSVFRSDPSPEIYQSPVEEFDEYSEPITASFTPEIYPKRLDFDAYESALPVIQEENPGSVRNFGTDEYCISEIDEEEEFDDPSEEIDEEEESVEEVPTECITEEIQRSSQHMDYEQDEYDPAKYEVKLIKKQLDDIEFYKIKQTGDLMEFQKDIDETRGLLHYINKRLDTVFDILNDRTPDECFLTNSELEFYFSALP